MVPMFVFDFDELVQQCRRFAYYFAALVDIMSTVFSWNHFYQRYRKLSYDPKIRHMVQLDENKTFFKKINKWKTWFLRTIRPFDIYHVWKRRCLYMPFDRPSLPGQNIISSTPYENVFRNFSWTIRFESPDDGELAVRCRVIHGFPLAVLVSLWHISEQYVCACCNCCRRETAFHFQ